MKLSHEKGLEVRERGREKIFFFFFSKVQSPRNLIHATVIPEVTSVDWQQLISKPPTIE